MAKAKRSTIQFKKRQLPAVLAARKKNKPMRLKAAAKVAKKKQAAANAGGGDEEEEVEEEPAGPAHAPSLDAFLDGDFGGSDDGEEESLEDDGDEAEQDGSDADMDLDAEGEEDALEQEDEPSGSDEEPGEQTGRLADVRASNKALRSELARHKADLDALKRKDPEFYAFLQSTDAELLAFRDSDEEDEGAEEEQPSAGRRDKAPAPEAPADLLTLARAKAWCAAASDGTSLGAVAKVLRAFRACAHFGDALGDGNEADDSPSTLRVTSSAAFHHVVNFVMENMPAILRALLQDGAAKGSAKQRHGFKPETMPRWKKVEPLVRSWLSSGHHLLTQLQDADISAYVLRSLAPAAPFAAPFPRRVKHLLRAALSRFGEGQPTVRVAALTLIRALASSTSSDGLDACLRGAYRTFAANAKFGGGGGGAAGGQLEHVAFMASAVSELVSIDTGAAYPVAFSAIRQLALLLRNALSARSQDALKAVLCWQTVHCLELWGRVLSSHASQAKDPLRPLVYPLMQVVTGAARLVPTARYAPLRLRLLALLQRLGAATSMYIPVATQAVDVMLFTEVSKPPLARASAGGSGSNYASLLRVPKTELKSPNFQSYVIDSGLDILTEALGQWAYHPTFPELAHLPVRELRRLAKQMHTPALRRATLSVAEAAAKNADWVARRREAATFAPKDCGPGSPALAAFMAEAQAAGAPLAAIVASRRAAARQRAAALYATDVRVGEGGAPAGRANQVEAASVPREAKKRKAAEQKRPRADAKSLHLDAGDGDDSGEDAVAELSLSE